MDPTLSVAERDALWFAQLNAPRAAKFTTQRGGTPQRWSLSGPWSAPTPQQWGAMPLSEKQALYAQWLMLPPYWRNQAPPLWLTQVRQMQLQALAPGTAARYSLLGALAHWRL